MPMPAAIYAYIAVWGAARFHWPRTIWSMASAPHMVRGVKTRGSNTMRFRVELLELFFLLMISIISFNIMMPMFAAKDWEKILAGARGEAMGKKALGFSVLHINILKRLRLSKWLESIV